MIGILLELRRYKKTNDYKLYAGSKYNYNDDRREVYYETFIDTDVDYVKVKPPSGSFFGNINGKTHYGWMDYKDDGTFFGNINGKTHYGWMPLPKQRVETKRKRVVERVVIERFRTKRNKKMRWIVNFCRYFDLKKELNKNDMDRLKIHITYYGFNEGVEHFTYSYVLHKIELVKEEEAERMKHR